eukprot:364372-Chlamydomonas_euryale.AAC.8
MAETKQVVMCTTDKQSNSTTLRTFLLEFGNGGGAARKGRFCNVALNWCEVEDVAAAVVEVSILITPSPASPSLPTSQPSGPAVLAAGGAPLGHKADLGGHELHTSTSSQPFSTLYQRPAALQTSSCSCSSAPTTPACAGSTAWAGGRMAPCTRRLRRARRRGCCLLEGWWAWVAWLAGHTPRGTKGAVAALHLVLTSRLAGWGWYGAAQDRAHWHALCDSAQPAA